MKVLKGNIFLLLASIIWGTAFVAQTTGMQFVGPLTFTFMRFFLGALAVIPLLIIYELKFVNKVFERPKSFFLIFATAIALGLGATIQQYALLYTDVSNAAFITALYVPMVPIVLKIFFRKNLHWTIWLAVIICLIGLFFLTTDEKTTIGNLADILLIFSAFAFSIQIILNDIYLQKNNTPFIFAFSQYFIIFIITMFIAFIFEKPSVSGISKEFFEIFYAGALSVGIAYTLQILGQNKMKPTPAAIILSMEAVFAAVAAWILIDQSMPPIKIFGCVLIFIGIIVAQVFPIKKIK